MNKTAIKNYAMWAREELILRVSQKAFEYGISNGNIIEENIESINGKLLSFEEKNQRKELIKKINEKGFDQVIEEVAYTWFNRFIALRYMEVNNYLPFKIRIFTNENNDFNPEILKDALNLDIAGINKEYIYDCIQNNKDQELYKYLLIAICNDMGNYLPGIFTKISDYKVLLFPDNLLKDESVLAKLVSEIDEDSWLDTQMENDSANGTTIIGWLYQYYISKRHDEVINILKGTVKKEDIPAATQLWTTDWVVRYMVDNSLGRYWIERNPNSELKSKLKFLATSKENELPVVNEKVSPEELTFLDPCMGSGHVLVYAFDVLMEIYRECGYSDRDAAISILENNLYGLDIDDRSYQLSYFSLMMKARSYNRRVLTKGVKCNIASIQESNHLDKFEYPGLTDDETINEIGEYLIHAFKNAKEMGSLLNIEPNDYSSFIEYLKNIREQGASDLFASGWINNDLPKYITLAKQAYIMSNKYKVCTTNPPYMGKLEGNLKQFVTKNYKDYSSDVFAVFMKRNFDFTIEGGYLGFMTPFVWMFIKSYEKLREFIISNKSIATLVQMEYSAYEEATVPICSFVLKNQKDDKPGYYYRLSDFKGGMEVQKQKVLEAQENKECGYFYETIATNFSEIPGSPIAYWASENAIDNFKYNNLKSFGNAVKGLDTCNNDTFVRDWYEINYHSIGLGITDCSQTVKKWFPYCKGGGYRKWYGLYLKVVNWENDGQVLRNLRGSNGKIKSRPQNTKFYFKEGITFSTITSAKLSMRYMNNSIFGGGGSGVFCDNIYSILSLLNSKIVDYYLNLLNPTLNFLVGDMLALPVNSNVYKSCINDLCDNNINFCKQDWDSFEISWDFTVHPLIKNHVSSIKEAYSLWDEECNDRFNTLKASEEELNRIFIDIYGLNDELDPYVEDKDVTVRKADLTRDIKSLISYAVGCMFGRYSLDVDGLAYAGGDFDWSKYSTFLPDKDNVIPISDDEYFEDDIVARFINFIKVVYGKDTLEENLDFIASALGGRGHSREVIRNYFLNDFYSDHCKIYQKRPIYWMFDSGNKNGFKCLVYMHRYQPDLVARIRTDYVHNTQSRLNYSIDALEGQLDNATTQDRVRMNKEINRLKEQTDEVLKYEELVHHYADMMMSIDLDDGVKVNYEKFKDLLAKIK